MNVWIEAPPRRIANVWLGVPSGIQSTETDADFAPVTKAEQPRSVVQQDKNYKRTWYFRRFVVPFSNNLHFQLDILLSTGSKCYHWPPLPWPIHFSSQILSRKNAPTNELYLGGSSVMRSATPHRIASQSLLTKLFSCVRSFPFTSLIEATEQKEDCNPGSQVVTGKKVAKVMLISLVPPSAFAQILRNFPVSVQSWVRWERKMIQFFQLRVDKFQLVQLQMSCQVIFPSKGLVAICAFVVFPTCVYNLIVLLHTTLLCKCRLADITLEWPHLGMYSIHMIFEMSFMISRVWTLVTFKFLFSSHFKMNI